MGQTLIIYCHPYDKSFNHAILERILKDMNQRGARYRVINLYAEKFMPFYTEAELALFNTGKTLDPLVLRYQEMLKEADQLIFITPIWWNDLPGMLKGFIDKVMKKKFAYLPTKTGIAGQLTNIKKAYVFTTSTSPTWYLKFFCGNSINRTFVKTTLKQLGIKNTVWHNLGGIDSKSPTQLQTYLATTSKLI